MLNPRRTVGAIRDIRQSKWRLGLEPPADDRSDLARGYRETKAALAPAATAEMAVRQQWLNEMEEAFGPDAARASIAATLDGARQAALEAGLDRTLDQTDGFARLVGRNKLARVFEHLIEEVFSFEDFVDQAEIQRLLERDHASGRREVDRACLAHQTRQPLRPAHPWNHPEIDLGKAGAPGVLFCDAHIASHRNLEAAPDTVTVDGRDRDLVSKGRNHR